MIKLTQNDWRLFRRLQRKHKVSTEFLRYNLENIEKFIWFETWPRIVIKRYTVRKENRVFIIYYRLRRVLFDQSNRKMLKRMRQNIKQWSKRIVAWQRAHLGIKEYVEEVIYENKSETKQHTVEATANEKEKPTHISNEDVSQKLKQQLELLKSVRRPQSLISNVSLEEKPTAAESLAEADKTNTEGEEVCEKTSVKEDEKQKSDSISVDDVSIKLKEQLIYLKARRETTAPLDIITPIDNDKNLDETAATATTREDWRLNLESTPEKQITTQENIQPIKQLDTDEKTEKSHNELNTPQAEKLKTGLNFLDMLICKVSGNANNSNFSQTNTANSNSTTTKLKESCLGRTSSSNSFKEGYQHHHEHSLDSTDEFLGFDDCERIPGMLMTPIVPHSTKNNKNSVFVSESLNEYMRLNDLETNYSIDEDKTIIKSKIFARDMEGLMTPKTKPPHFDMPAVPENLLKFRTVAERKQYLQKFSKNYRLAIINNEAIIYRELQRRMRTQKVKSASQMLAQSPNSSMSFTRNGWNAASFINTEFNKYYYQKLDVDYGMHKVCLRGARGNNDEFYKTPYVSRVIKPSQECFDNCADDKIWHYLKPIKTITPKTKKLNKDPLPSVFKPCPLSHKTFQKPLDDDTAALLLAGGSMAVVRMPTVELEVFPECGKPLHEIAKRYLQYILPHHDISREWAEFSVSTLQQPKSLKEAEQAAAKSFNKEREFRKSYTFVIPYLNDRNHILVRRVVDRSEKLDQSFEKCLEERELVPKTDFQFRQNIDKTDEVLLTCADVVSDMINTVAISCSENSFIKDDPDGLHKEENVNSTTKISSKHDSNSLERPISSSPNNVTTCGNVKKQKKQNSLLLELKRLNATIIDAAVKPENDKKPCSKDYCQMGCICVSLEDNMPIREHCGKPKCMLECNCKPSNQSRIMRLETDGRTLTSEDAFMLRRKATARLARMEKEFTSTVVLTENETLLINETNNDKKRRCTKAPKRYEDFTDTEDEQRRNSPKKTALTTIDREKHLAIEIKEVHEPVYVKDTILEQLKHCTVNLVALPNMDNIAPWCMVHNLYKCFCKGRALEGKPIIIEKEEINNTIEHDAEPKLELDCNVNVKAKYTFDKVEKKRKLTQNDDIEIKDVETANGADVEDNQNEEKNEDADNDETDRDWIKESKRKKKEKHDKLSEKLISKETVNIESTNSEVELDESLEDEYTRYSPTEQDQTMKQKSKRSLHEVRKRFYQSRYESCRRHIPTPRRMFLYCNRRRRLNVLKFIKEHENEQTRLLLNEHIMRSVYYHKIDTENLKKNNQENSNNLNQKLKDVEETKSDKLTQNSQTNAESIEQSKNCQMPVEEVVDLLEDEDETSCMHTVIKDRDENTQLTSSSTKSCSSFEKISPDPEISDTTNHFQICSSNGVITVKKFATLTDLKIAEGNKEKPMQITPVASASTSTANKTVNVLETESDEIKLPKISSCFSLNIKANVPKPANTLIQPEKQNLDFTSATSLHSAAFAQSQKPQDKNLHDSFAGSSSSSKTCDISSLGDDNESMKDVYNSVIKTMNSLVSKKMQDIDCALQRESHIIPTPNPDILCIMKWCNFLDAFGEGFAYVWQVKIKDATFFVVTIQNIMPLIPGAMGIVNITALKPDKMPLMGKMLLQKFRSKETEKLAVVMQGKSTHWVVKGFLKSDPSTACNKPTPETHPSLTKKINVLCSLLVKQKHKEQKKKEKLIGQWVSPQMNASTQQSTSKHTQSPIQTTPKVAQILPMRRLATVQPSTQAHSASTPQHLLNPTITQNPVLSAQLQQPQQPVPPMISDIQLQTTLEGMQKSSKQCEIKESSKKVVSKQTSRKRKMISTAQSGHSLKMDVYSKMNSNIEFRNVTQSDLDEIFLPELHKLDHKWLVLDLHNDFSHIFVPEFRDLVSLDRIQKVINFARQKSKIVKMQFFQNAPFDAFVTPKSGRKIFFGPLTMEMKSPTLILLQSVDGQMMLRELYQLQHNIMKKPEEKTKAFWLIHLKGKTHFEINSNAKYEKTSTTENLVPILHTTYNNKNKTGDDNELLTATTNISSNEEVKNNADPNHDDGDDDEDCMIIDDTMENADISATTSTSSCNLSINASNNETVLKVMPQTNALSSPHVMQSLKITKTNNMDSSKLGPHTQSVLTVPNTNTIIKPLNPLNTTMPVLINVPPMSTTNNPLPILTLPPNTIITGINPTPTSADVVMPAPVINLPTTAMVTGIQTAPPEAPYSSTIYITPSSSVASLGTATATVTTTTSSSSVAFNISNSLESQQILTNDLKSAKGNTASNIMKHALEAGAIKRRRISLFCSNKYDKVSENLAVDAVIRKILPDNAEEIQINPTSSMRDEQNMPRPEVVATVGSTKISKIPSTDLKTIVTSTKPTTTSSISSGQSKTPIVFDVNFMDDGDEPTASILIKPNTSEATAATDTTDSLAATQNRIAKTVNARTTVSNTNTSLLKGQIMTATIGGNINSNTSTVNRNAKLPIQTVNKPAANSDNLTGRTKLINSILNTKQQQQQSNIVPKFSTPRSVAPKVSTPSSNVVTSSLTNISTTTTNTVNPFTFRRSSVSVKVLNSTNAVTMQTTKPITTSATVSLNPTSPTLTVQQVQDILNKSSNNTPATSPATSPLTSMPLQIMPAIKATITPAKMTAITNVSATITTTSSGVLANSLTSDAVTAEVTSPNVESSTLTISKVQSFGSPQKSPNTNDKNLNTPIVINDVNEPQQIPTPPPHIQYGYIVSASYVNQKFVAKRVADEFYVKVPSVGILKLQGLTAVNNYLNKHISKKDTQNSTAVWQFVAASKAVQMQNHQKSLLVRKIKNPNAIAAGCTKNKNTTISDSSLDEPILIDD
ncbi:over compensating males isoform 1-T2 [Cochliomyia hominivorax]